MNHLTYDPPRPTHQIITGDIVELHSFTTTKKFFRTTIKHEIIGYGEIVEFIYEDGYIAIIKMSGKLIQHTPEHLKLVQKVENRSPQLIEEIEKYLTNQ